MEEIATIFKANIWLPFKELQNICASLTNLELKLSSTLRNKKEISKADIEAQKSLLGMRAQKIREIQDNLNALEHLDNSFNSKFKNELKTITSYITNELEKR